MNKNYKKNVDIKKITLDTGDEILFRWIDPNKIKWEKYKPIFISAFSDVFKSFSASELDLKIADKGKGIQDWYTEETLLEKNFIAETNSNKKRFYLLQAEANGKIIAYSIWHWSAEKSNYVYQSNLCVLPEWQNKTIGTRMVHAIKEKLPNTEKFIADTRKSYKNKANQFYKDHLECIACPIFPDESLTNPEKFIGYEGILLDESQLNDFLKLKQTTISSLSL